MTLHFSMTLHQKKFLTMVTYVSFTLRGPSLIFFFWQPFENLNPFCKGFETFSRVSFQVIGFNTAFKLAVTRKLFRIVFNLYKVPKWFPVICTTSFQMLLKCGNVNEFYVFWWFLLQLRILGWLSWYQWFAALLLTYYL